MNDELKRLTESELFDEENWFDFGLTEHIETEQFQHWRDVAIEIARIAGCEHDSPMEALFLQCAASASKLGFDCDFCGKISRPLNSRHACPKCADKMAMELAITDEQGLRNALQLCLDYFKREISDDPTMINSDFGEAHRACVKVLMPNGNNKESGINNLPKNT